MKTRIWLGLIVVATSLGLASCDADVRSMRAGILGSKSSAAPAHGDAPATSASVDGQAGGQGAEADDAAGSGDRDAGDKASPRKAPKAETLTWKRYRPFENALMTGLALRKEEVCLELGQSSCIDRIHLTVLGGNEPYENGQYDRAAAPTILTSVAVERIVLAACDKRLSLDKALGAGAVVFKHWSLAGGKVTADQLESQTQDIYRRLLARDPTKAELDVAGELLGMMGAPDKLALSLCFMVGTQAESVFL